MPIATCTADNSWWWAQKMPETCRVSWQNKILDTWYILLVIYTKTPTFAWARFCVTRSFNKLQLIYSTITGYLWKPGKCCLLIPIPMAARSKAWGCDRSPTGTESSNPAGAWMSVFYGCVSGRGLCVRLITRPEESYRVCCEQWVWSQSPVRGGQESESRRSATGGGKKFKNVIYW
jgi:hypothetical protein